MKAAGAVIAVTCLAAVGASSFFHQRVAKRSTDCHQGVRFVTATDSKPPTDGDGPTQGDRAKKENALGRFWSEFGPKTMNFIFESLILL
jgi:hypothetical protein